MSAISGRDRISATLEAKAGTGDALAIALAPLEEGGTAFWTITVDAETEGDDLIRVGSIVVPPREPTEVRSPRVVAGAYFPGVKRWHVDAVATGKAVNVLGSVLALSAGNRPTSNVAPSCAWVWSVTSDGLDLPCAPAVFASGLADQITMAVRPVWLVGAHGTNPSAGTLYAGVYNYAAPLVGGETPEDEVIAPAGSSWELPIATPFRLGTGLTIALSTTPGAFAAAAVVARLTGRFRHVGAPQ